MGAAGSVAGSVGTDPNEVTEEELAVFKKLKTAYEEKKAEEGADDQAIFAHLKTIMGGMFTISATDSAKLDEAVAKADGGVAEAPKTQEAPAQMQGEKRKTILRKKSQDDIAVASTQAKVEVSATNPDAPKASAEVAAASKIDDAANAKLDAALAKPAAA
jgi:hypothetical protein